MFSDQILKVPGRNRSKGRKTNEQPAAKTNLSQNPPRNSTDRFRGKQSNRGKERKTNEQPAANVSQNPLRNSTDRLRSKKSKSGK
jgi:hypothetical protein